MNLPEIVRNNIDEFTKTLNKLIGKQLTYTILDDVVTFYFDGKQFNITELNNKLRPYLNQDIGLGITTILNYQIPLPTKLTNRKTKS